MTFELLRCLDDQPFWTNKIDCFIHLWSSTYTSQTEKSGAMWASCVKINQNWICWLVWNKGAEFLNYMTPDLHVSVIHYCSLPCSFQASNQTSAQWRRCLAKDLWSLNLFINLSISQIHTRLIGHLKTWSYTFCVTVQLCLGSEGDQHTLQREEGGAILSTRSIGDYLTTFGRRNQLRPWELGFINWTNICSPPCDIYVCRVHKKGQMLVVARSPVSSKLVVSMDQEDGPWTDELFQTALLFTFGLDD